MKFEKYLDFIEVLRQQTDEETVNKIKRITEKILKHYKVKLDTIFLDALDTVMKKQDTLVLFKNDIVSSLTSMMREYLYVQGHLIEKKIITSNYIQPYNYDLENLLAALDYEIKTFVTNFKDQSKDEPQLKEYVLVIGQVFEIFLESFSREIEFITSKEYLLNAVVTFLPVVNNIDPNTYADTEYKLDKLNQAKEPLNDQSLIYVKYLVTFINIFSEEPVTSEDIVELYNLNNQ